VNSARDETDGPRYGEAYWAHRAQRLADCGDVQRARHALHQDVADVGQDDPRREQHQQREHEGADRVRQLEPRVVLRDNGNSSFLRLSDENRLYERHRRLIHYDAVARNLCLQASPLDLRHACHGLLV